MKKEIREISEDGKIVRVTIADERWYIKQDEMKEYPSVTWIADHYPKGIGFYKYLANKGWDNAEADLVSAGNRGTKVHEAIALLLLGNEIKMDDKLHNSETGELEDITLEEYEAIMSFVAWHKETKPKTLAIETVVFNDEYMYAGTADYVCEIADKKTGAVERWLIDFKTSKAVWPSYEIQLSAYAKALPPELKPDKLAILQVGYALNKNKYKFTEIDDQFDLFLAARTIWQKERSTSHILKKEYPVSVSL